MLLITSLYFLANFLFSAASYEFLLTTEPNLNDLGGDLLELNDYLESLVQPPGKGFSPKYNTSFPFEDTNINTYSNGLANENLSTNNKYENGGIYDSSIIPSDCYNLLETLETQSQGISIPPFNEILQSMDCKVKDDKKSLVIWIKLFNLSKRILKNISLFASTGNFFKSHFVIENKKIKAKATQSLLEEDIKSLSFIFLPLPDSYKHLKFNCKNEIIKILLTPVFDTNVFTINMLDILNPLVKTYSTKDLIFYLLKEISNNKIQLQELKSLLLIVFCCYNDTKNDAGAIIEQNSLKKLISKAILIIVLINIPFFDINERIPQHEYNNRLNFMLIKSLACFVDEKNSDELILKLDNYKKVIQQAKKQKQCYKPVLQEDNLVFPNHFLGKDCDLIEIYLTPIITLTSAPEYSARFKKLGYVYVLKSIEQLYKIGDILLENWA